MNDEFGEWVKSEEEKEKARMCKEYKGICDNCPNQEYCFEEELIRDLYEW